MGIINEYREMHASWFEYGVRFEYLFMVIGSDSSPWGLPHFAFTREDAKEIVATLGDKAIAVYDLSHDANRQLDTPGVWNL